MPVYTVHAPVTPDDGADVRATDRFAFVRDGFHFWAFVWARYGWPGIGCGWR
jgi:hypothetical protein